MAPSQNQALPTFRELVWFIRNIMTVHKKGGGRGNDETIVLIKISEIKIKATHSHVWKKVALCCHLVKFPTVNMGKKKRKYSLSSANEKRNRAVTLLMCAHSVFETRWSLKFKFSIFHQKSQGNGYTNCVDTKMVETS